MFKGKITVIGAGNVGATIVYTMVLSGLVSEVVLIDINKDKAEGDAMDMNHGLCFVSPVRVIAGDYCDIKGSDMVIITAGANQREGEKRTDLLKRNAGIFKDIVDHVLKYCHDDTILMVVTNPVDILTYITYKLSGFSKQNVIGSGTVLDTARLKYLLGEHTNVDVRNVHTYIIGEHGDSEVAAWSVTNVAGMGIEQYCTSCGCCNSLDMCKETFYNRTRNAAYEIIDKKGATYYAIALAVRRIVESIIGNENSILTVSSLFEGEYGISDVCLSVPTIVGSEGAERILEIDFSEQELLGLRESAGKLKQLAKEIGF
ncbi:L-lactate dehydrogenase [Ructibacterium gallinarum]|uniref:L-lactate dehydrogenase n=1 Tax=Ructibacterium gallinarum TaxID=2779355 RepID=A0A9D5M597_9FIRM|nr:L-lactate dehydrogenase [Ructibacterium gallinarum]MBE5039677.1 L-lactate dehydrogenase [Ructibacterium gallinarum]